MTRVVCVYAKYCQLRHCRTLNDRRDLLSRQDSHAYRWPRARPQPLTNSSPPNPNRAMHPAGISLWHRSRKTRAMNTYRQLPIQEALKMLPHTRCSDLTGCLLLLSQAITWPTDPEQRTSHLHIQPPTWHSHRAILHYHAHRLCKRP